MHPMIAEQVMKRTPKCLNEKDTAQNADGGRAIGIISLSDIAQHEDKARAGTLLCNITQREVRAA
jgi:hypothetical protein